MSKIEKKLLDEVGLAPNTKNKEEENISYISFMEKEDFILEQVKITTHTTHTHHSLVSGTPAFILYSKLDDTLELIDQIIIDQTTYKPISDDTFSKGGVLLPSGAEEYQTTDKLVEEISSFLDEYCEVPEFFKKILPSMVLFYWVYDRFPFIPYLHFVGGTGTGKTTAMETLGSICYKTINTTGALTIASLFRIATTWGGTMLIDEFDHLSDNANEMTAFLKAGVSDRLILRTEGEGKKEVKAYKVKSPKMFTSENPIDDAGLQSRTLVIHMQKNKRPVPLYKLPEYDDAAEKLRNKLLMWRFRHMNKIDLRGIKMGFPELKHFDGRVQQILTPIYYLSEGAARAELLEFAKKQEEETMRERRESLSGQIFQVILDDGSSLIPLSKITDTINAGKTQFLTSAKKVGNVVRKLLGFDIQRMGDQNISTVMIDLDKVAEWKEYYFPRPSEKRGQSVVSVVVEELSSLKGEAIDESNEATEWLKIAENNVS